MMREDVGVSEMSPAAAMARSRSARGNPGSDECAIKIRAGIRAISRIVSQHFSIRISKRSGSFPVTAHQSRASSCRSAAPVWHHSLYTNRSDQKCMVAEGPVIPDGAVFSRQAYTNVRHLRQDRWSEKIRGSAFAQDSFVGCQTT